MYWIVFDYGEVISRRTQALPDLAAVLGADPIEFEAAYWSSRDGYDRGSTDLEYWSAVGRQLGSTVDEKTADRLTGIDTNGWLEIEQSTMDLLADLRSRDTRLALLSNAPASFGRLVEKMEWSSLFDHMLFSGDLGVAKPDAEIWAALLQRLDAQPGDCVFFDDRQINIDGAVAYGLTGRLWSTAEDARTHLTALRVLD
ncbi:MAG: HAD family phosphatase [Kibdelosporangium sp.]